MRVLFDQGAPAPLRNYLPDHQVSTAYELGCGRVENGELLRLAAESRSDVLVTTDHNQISTKLDGSHNRYYCSRFH